MIRRARAQNACCGVVVLSGRLERGATQLAGLREAPRAAEPLRVAESQPEAQKQVSGTLCRASACAALHCRRAEQSIKS